MKDFLMFSLLFFVYSLKAITVAPTWVTSNYVKASSYLIINGTIKVGSTQTPTATMTFSSAFSSVPHIAYGVSDYESSDNLGQEMYQVYRTGVTQASISVLVKISGNTDVWVLRVRYVAVDKLFPHHLNSFDNVPCNYSNGALTIFSTKSLTAKTYTNNINYTTQGSIYTTFSTPLSNNKILMFMTSMYLDGGMQSTSSFSPIDLKVNAVPSSIDLYQITVTLGIQVIVTRLHYSMIIFDQYDVELSGQYFLVYDRYDFPTSGGSVEVPIQFVPSLIMAFTDFYAYRTQTCITFFLNQQTLSNGAYGIQMPPSAPRDTGRNKITRFGYSLFYLKTWSCPTGYYLNLTINLCEDCTINYCSECLNSTYCRICNSSSQKNVTTGQCEPIQCNLSYCLGCISTTQCGLCDMNSSYYLDNGSCLLCNNSLNLFIEPINLTCISCSIAYCLNCSSLTSCLICDVNAGYYLFSSNNSDTCVNCSIIPHCVQCTNLSTCTKCNITEYYFMNLAPTSTSDQCIFCNLSNCLQCNNLSLCVLCNQSNYFYLNATAGLCEPCSVPNCILCGNITSCLQCDTVSGYFMNPSPTTRNDQCIQCSINQCISCSSLTTCTQCNQSNSYFLNHTDNLCYLCSLFQCLQCSSLTTCLLCNTSNFYTLNSVGQCQLSPAVCGDNIFSPQQECDDGNLNDRDGCSSACKTQPQYLCQLNTAPNVSNSICFFMGEITLEVTNIIKIDLKNQVHILIEIGPKNLPFWDIVDFSSMVILSNTTFFDNYEVIRNQDGTVSVLANYNSDIQGMNITVELDPSLSGQKSLSRLNSTYKNFIVNPNNEAALYYNEQTYHLSKILSILSLVIAGLYLLTFVLGLFSLKIIGIEMMAVIQISYLSLISLSSLNPCFKALSNLKFVNGFSYFYLNKQFLYQDILPKQIGYLSLSPYFMENYNLNFLLICIPCILGIIILVISHTYYKRDNQKKEKYSKIGKRCLCQFAFNGLMFSGYIISVSLTLEFKFGMMNLNNMISLISLIWSFVTLVILFIYFGFFIKFAQYFGEFTQYFSKKSEKDRKYKISMDSQKSVNLGQQKQQVQCQPTKKWYNLLILQRLVIGSCLILLLEYKISGIITIGIFLILIILALIFKPYKQLKHTIRYVCNLAICITIQIIYLLYRLAKNEGEKEQKIWLYLPILICILLIICLVYNIGFLIYELRKNRNANNEHGQCSKIVNNTVITQTEQFIAQQKVNEDLVRNISRQKQLLKQLKNIKEISVQKKGNEQKKQYQYQQNQYDMI